MNNKTVLRIISLICAVGGFLILGFVLFPLISYELTSPRYASYLSPVPEELLATEAVDYTKASNWFVNNGTAFDNKSVLFYTITVPKLGIKNAAVSIGGEDLSDSLIQYPGTAVPGKPGNAVIFGHSILPQFFNPKDYLSIFSTLPSLKRGDSILIEYDGISYQYRVEDTFEVKPTDIQILQQNPSDSFLTLVTCTPPGHPLRPRRLIVRARVVPLGEREFKNI